MKKNKLLLSISLCAVTAMYGQAPLFHIDNDGLFFIGENALIFNGGSLQTRGTGLYDIHGNLMVVGNSSSFLRTINVDDDAEKLSGANIVLRLNDPLNFATSTYGQLYISGLSQSNISAIVDKEYRDNKHGQTNYFQQMALPFYQKKINTLSAELGKTFANQRWTQNEILKFDNINVVSIHYTDLQSNTIDPTGYYMLGSKNNDFDASSPFGNVYTIHGRPYADNISVILENAGTNVDFGIGGNAKNQYTEKYNTYVQDKFDFSTDPWQNNYGKNLYQFGNPFFTNLDLSKIGYIESAQNGDANQISSIQGIRYDAGVVQTMANGTTYSTGALIQTFVTTPGINQGTPVGDTGLIIKPMQPFVIKLTDKANSENNPIYKTLNFDKLRRFNSTIRNDGADYDVTTNKVFSTNTVKQLGVKGLDSNGQEIARAYYVVYPDAITGHPTKATTQATNSSNNFIGTFEEDKQNGGYDNNYINSYWLYINEANEVDFYGKAIPFAIYSDKVKSLKFEILENTIPIAEQSSLLSTGIGFYYKQPNGQISAIEQNKIIPVTSSEYYLYYGKKDGVLIDNNVKKPSRTKLTYNSSIDDFVLIFDPNWRYADIKIFDMNGRIIKTANHVKTDTDYQLILSKVNAGYIVSAISEKGEIFQSKIIR